MPVYTLPEADSTTSPATAVSGRLRGFHPGWYGAIMGTAIVGIIGYQDPGGVAGLADAARVFGVAMVALAAVLAIGLGIPYVARWARYPDAARADLANPSVGALYGTFPGGILVLAVGIATVGSSVLAADMTAALVAVLAAIGIALAVVVSVAFAAQLFLNARVEPPTANGAWFIPPVVTIIGLSLPFLFGGAVVVETIFSWPGMGRLAVEAIYARDYPTVLAINFVVAALVTTAGLGTRPIRAPCRRTAASR